MLVYLLFTPIIFFEYLHQYIFSAKYDKNYDPYTIKDTVYDILPEPKPMFDRSMYILNNIGVTTVTTSLVCYYYVDLFYVFLFARTIRIICIFLLKLPNPYKNAHLERERCHDLIVSGHTTSYITVLLGVNRLNNIPFTITCLFILTHYFWYIIKKQHHYSLDVFLGIYVTLSSNVILTHFEFI